jgi:hypothetical protein
MKIYFIICPIKYIAYYISLYITYAIIFKAQENHTAAKIYKWHSLSICLLLDTKNTENVNLKVTF